MIVTEPQHSVGNEVTSSRKLHLGIVHGVRDIRFVAAAGTAPALMPRLAEYVAGKAAVQLYPEDAERLRRLLFEGANEAAVRFYFERVGERWDREWLDETTVTVG